jgi:hypothetical protein
LLGDWEQADAVNDRLMRVPPEGPGRIYRRLILPGLKGQTEVALQRMRESFKDLGLTLHDLPSFERAIAGIHLARGGAYNEAIEALEPVIDPDVPATLDDGPGPYGPGADMLAWSYLQAGDRTKADRLLAAVARECDVRRAGRLRDSWGRFRCAEADLLRGDVDRALSGLEQAVEAGWREYYVRESDPLWASVAKHPRYRTLMAKVKADVDRQRVELERADPNRAFTERLDAAIAARPPAGP